MRGTQARLARTAPSAVLVGVVLVAGCATTAPSTVVKGHAVSMRFDPNRVAGLPASEGPSGPKVSMPIAAGRVVNTNDGSIDRLALLAVDDIEEFWQNNYGATLPGFFSPVSVLVSIDPEASRPEVCGSDPEEFGFNAAYCVSQDLMAWDRVGLLPAAQRYFGDMAVTGLIAHEYGHAVQHGAELVDRSTPELVSEQQADCFAAVYLRWVAEGRSPRFEMNTTTALDKVLAGAIAVRDRPPDLDPFGLLPVAASHGTALDRVSAFQLGFDTGASSCASIDLAEVRQRRGDIPAALFDPTSPQSDMAVTEQALASLIEVLNGIFKPSRPPTLRIGMSCGRGAVNYCPESNTVEADLEALQNLGTPASEGQRVLLQGDNTAISAVTSRYMLALQNDRGTGLEGENAAMRTACLTGAAQNRMSDSSASNNRLVLGAGDLDEAVSGLLTNGIAASDVHGTTVPSGFTRILAFRSGLSGGDADACYRRFPTS